MTMRPIIVATDFSAAADVAIDCAIGLAEIGRASVTLVHICEPGASDTEVDAARQRLAELTHNTGRDVPIGSVVRSGVPWEKLGNVAIDVGAGVIVIAAGEVASRLVAIATRPVLVVPPDPPSLRR